MNRFFILVGGLLAINLLPTTARAQLSFAVGPGLTQYVGDVNKGSIGNNRMAFNVEGWYPLTDNWQLKSGLSVYGLRAEDTDLTRLRSFRTTNVEFYSSAMYYLKRGYLTPFAYLGLGATTSRPRGESPLGNWDLRDVRPEGTAVPGLLAMIPFGVGLEYELTPTLAVVVDAAARYVLSDQLDAVSRANIPAEELSSLAIDYYESLSDDVARRLDEDGAATGGNPADNDWYGIFSVKLRFTPAAAGCLDPNDYSFGRRRGKRNYTPL